MSIAGLGSVTSTGKEFSTIQSQTLDKDDFLSLLITQLQHQDPLNPTDSVEFTAQLAQFSSLEQLGNVNANLIQLQNFQASINNSQAVSLIGKEITADGNFLQLTDGQPAGCNFKLAKDAAIVVVSIYDDAGGFVQTFESRNLSAGPHTLFWDGTDKSGNRVGAGDYTFEILAADAGGGDIEAGTFFSGTVNKVTFENNKTYVISGNQKIALGDVIEVAAPEKITEATQSITEHTNPLNEGGN